MDFKGYINQYLDLLIKEIDACIDMQSAEELFLTRKHILIVKSARNQVLESLLDGIYEHNPNIRVSILGDISDDVLLSKYNKDLIEVYAHEGKFKRNEIDNYIQQIHVSEIDAICFLNYRPHAESYLNIEEVCACLADRIKCDVFSFLGNEKTFVLYKKIRTHIITIEAYCAVMRWLEEYITKESEL